MTQNLMPLNTYFRLRVRFEMLFFRTQFTNHTTCITFKLKY